MFCVYFVIGGFTAGPCLVSGRSATLESRAAYLQAAQTSKSLLTFCARSSCWGSVACEGSGSHERAPALPLATSEQTGRRFEQLKSQRHLPGGTNMSDNNWNVEKSLT